MLSTRRSSLPRPKRCLCLTRTNVVRDKPAQIETLSILCDQSPTRLCHIELKHANSASVLSCLQSKLLVVGAVGGRLDHQLSNIHMLYRFQDLRIVLLGKGNLALLLPETFEHEIYPDRRVEGPICALIPVGCPVSDVHTTGLRWNLGEQIATLSLSLWFRLRRWLSFSTSHVARSFARHLSGLCSPRQIRYQTSQKTQSRWL